MGWDSEEGERWDGTVRRERGGMGQRGGGEVGWDSEEGREVGWDSEEGERWDGTVRRGRGGMGQ